MTSPAPGPHRPVGPQLADAGRRLHAERARLQGVLDALGDDALRAESQAESTAEIAPTSQHLADVGTETFERERDLTMVADVRDELRQVERALRSLSAGHYGSCEWCGEPIPSERLQAMPAARFCLRHEERYELGGLHLADLEPPQVQVAGEVDEARPIVRTHHARHVVEVDVDDFLAADDDLDEPRPESVLSSEVAAMHVQRDTEMATDANSD